MQQLSASTKIVNKDAFTRVCNWQDVPDNEAAVSDYALVHPKIFSLRVCAKGSGREVLEMVGLRVCEFQYFERKDDDESNVKTY